MTSHRGVRAGGYPPGLHHHDRMWVGVCAGPAAVSQLSELSELSELPGITAAVACIRTPPTRAGYDDGYRQGLDAARDGDRYDVRRESWYRSGDRGYDRRYGSRTQYRQVYRSGFSTGLRRRLSRRPLSRRTRTEVVAGADARQFPVNSSSSKSVARHSRFELVTGN